jgi:RNA polymerase sigma-32 factor
MAHLDDTEIRRANFAFIRKAMKAPVLAREHEFDLARRWRESGDQAALHQLVSAYTRMVIAIANRYRFYGLPIGDLIQEGNVGLMHAAARFEPSREVRFSTYATWWVRAQMQDFVLRNWSIVRTGTTAAHKRLFFNLRRLRARIEETPSGQLPAEAATRIARVLDVGVGEVQAMNTRLSRADQSLNAPIDENGTDQWQDLLVDSRPDPERVTIDQRDTRTRLKWLAEALEELSARERQIIHQRRLADDQDAATLELLGSRLGVSKERVRQLEQRAMLKLRNALERRISETSDLFPV